MAKRIVNIYVDDLTGEETAEAVTHTFSLDGITYELDLSPDSYDAMLEAFAPFIKVARRTRASKRGKASPGPEKQATADSAALRKWARENGYSVNTRGQIARSIRDAYSEFMQST
ncbi:histone-like nucleoid-structuring protein Lsr2 [Streptomyces sp. 1222.5]|uniref:histone-like nucleoid-structuring protein Lsr2 n=1 Tax=Streptomyces sp. 1222.5 TaxID=1881026 RepID=UPI003EBC456C